MITFQQAIKAMETRSIVLPNIYYGELQGTYRSLAFSIAGVSEVSQLERVLELLTATLNNGSTFEEWKSEILAAGDKAVKLPNYRLDNIFRTNNQTAYMRGKSEQILENKESRRFLMYSAVGDERTRPSHLANDGRVEAIDSPFWSTWYPANGYRCRCSVISLNEKQAAKLGNQDAKFMLKNPDRKILRTESKPDSGWDYSVLTENIKKQTELSILEHKQSVFADYLKNL